METTTTSKSSMKKKVVSDESLPSSSIGGRFVLYVIIPLLLYVFVTPIVRTIRQNQPLKFIYPNLLMYTPFSGALQDAWKDMVSINGMDKVQHEHIPIIPREKYNYEALKKATNNFRSPALVRGLFLGTKAIDNWHKDGYLAQYMGDFLVPVVMNNTDNTGQDNRIKMTIKDAFSNVVNNPGNRMYLFFPVKTRFHLDELDPVELDKLQVKINERVVEDLEVSPRIWNGFGTSAHKPYLGSQLIIGVGSNDTVTTGSAWHVAMGNNYFAQVKGEKRWYFLDSQKYSPYLYPLRGGRVNMVASNKNMKDWLPYVGLQYADVKEGDLLYNPDWQWHKISNKPGLSIGVPMREFNFTLSARNNLQYTTIALMNTIVNKFGLDIGGYGQKKKDEE